MVKTILLVDDDIDYLIQQKMLLEKEGFKIITSENKDKTRKILRYETFNVAVVDLMMEEMDSGFTLCYQIKKKYPEIPVIMLTAVTNQTGYVFDAITETEKKWIKADSILTKPIRTEQLVKEIKRLSSNEQ